MCGCGIAGGAASIVVMSPDMASRTEPTTTARPDGSGGNESVRERRARPAAAEHRLEAPAEAVDAEKGVRLLAGRDPFLDGGFVVPPAPRPGTRRLPAAGPGAGE